MRPPRWILLLPLSAALHALGLLLLLWWFARAGDLPLLFVDLTALDLDHGGFAVSAPEDPPDSRAGGRPATTSHPAGRGWVSGAARGTEMAARSSRSGTRGRFEAEILAATPAASDSARPTTPSASDSARPTTPSASDGARPTPSASGGARPAAPVPADGVRPTAPVPADGLRQAVPLTPDVTRSSPSAVREESRETVIGAGEATRLAPVPSPSPAVGVDARGGELAYSWRAPGTARADQALAPSASRSTASGGAGRTVSNPGGPTADAGRGEGEGARAESGGSGRGPEGSALVGSGGGAGGVGAEYGPYLAQWRRRIHENLRYPLAARRRGLTGTVHLDIVIRPTGAVVSVEVSESSSHGLLDEAAIEAVRGLSPLPFPGHLAPRPLRARLPVVFDLR